MIDLKKKVGTRRLKPSPQDEVVPRMLDQEPLPVTPPGARRKIDGRTLRRTGRTQQFSTKIKPETHDLMLQIADEDEISLAALVELAIAEYADRRKAARSSD
jgi:hypothetical protein